MNKKVCAILGLALILIQAVAFYGMSGEITGLYPDMEDIWDHGSSYVSPPDPGKITIMKFFFGLTAGADRFTASFVDLFHDRYEYRPMSSEQVTSALLRESFGCYDGGSVDLILYDSALTISYSIVGIIGLFFIILSIKMRD
jgi:hypothetical protein